ncbi:AraC family transcriptional regulator [Paenibacillus aceris]|uniref:YesN/AraC family two-component response regulator n=1 Tax=Paenibacillus aceris TaxID=869555 RepID=A0ABS4HXZ1_9BACL|nr:AraC family transcriptional regulator [Paenibacillus aceris]MBP1963206.1 YesN/AraC family two-component response regulator [Paenibacillus aceris]NHW38678.1 AraC family transcriptional regulator [Paenibacillus aceris]
MEKFGVNILWTSRYDYDRGRELHMHMHDYYQMIYFLNGAGIFTCDGSTYTIKPGSLFFIHPMQSHGFVPHAYDTRRMKTLDLKFHIHDSQLIQKVKMVPVHQADSTSELKQWLERIRREGTMKALFYGESACLCLVQMLYMLCRKASKTDVSQLEFHASEGIQTTYEPTEAAKRVEHYLKEYYYSEALTLENVSERISYSKSYISQTIKHNYGCSFTHFLQKIRVEKAKEHIMYSDQSLKQIAEKVGFKTIHHFNRVFKGVEGISPGKWKQRELGGICKDVSFD